MTLLDLADADAAGVERVGGKAIGLAKLCALGLPVPETRILPAAAHRRWLKHRGLAPEDRESLREVVAELGRPLAARSSATDEDAGERSAAGQYESVMGIGTEQALAEAAEMIFRTAGGERARAYRDGEPPDVALVIQREIAAQRAGIGFSADPVSGDRSSVLLEVVFGHGEGAASGQVTPDRYRVSSDGAVAARVADKALLVDRSGQLAPTGKERRIARTLRDDEARELAAMIRVAERGMGRAVDVEFCFAGPVLWAVQCRPITAL
jgi:phosphoenolpyruvate synthase/pyruvate phosphate dikinase